MTGGPTALLSEKKIGEGGPSFRNGPPIWKEQAALQGGSCGGAFIHAKLGLVTPIPLLQRQTAVGGGEGGVLRHACCMNQAIRRAGPIRSCGGDLQRLQHRRKVEVLAAMQLCLRCRGAHG